jgi:imidazoleglycerol-phosphate dehydratase
MRRADLTRDTAETRIAVSVALDGRGAHRIATGVGFFDHMLAQLSRHSLIDMDVKAEGDRHVDDHHTVEDVGILLGRAVAQALGDKRGVRRYGACLLPMDEALIRAALDLSGRPFLVWNVPFAAEKIGTFDTQLVREFFIAFAMNARITLHVERLAGENAHHVAESAFKAVARALREAVEPDPRGDGLAPSTKGTLDA